MKNNFKDEIIIDGKKVLDIPLENMFYEEKERKFESKWSSPPRRTFKPSNNDNVKFTQEGLNKENIYFDPLKALIYKEQPLLAISSKEQKAATQLKRSRWGQDFEKTFQPPPLNVIPKNLNLEEIEYLIRLHRLDDLNRKQQQGILETIDPEVRSPSPEPVYDPSGRRVNTLENRIKNSMIIEKNNLIEECQKMNMSFMIPNDWRALKKTRKIYLPEYDNPELNYVSVVLGPKGRTQKLLEELSNCRISIRGRQFGNNKRPDFQEEEQTHVLVQAENDQELEKGVEMVQKILRGESLQQIAGDEKKYIKTGYEMMAVETVLRDFCENCKEEGHKLWSCPYMFNDQLRKRQEKFKEANKVTNIFAMGKCETCGGKSHTTKDCPKKKLADNENEMNIHLEYFKFLNEINANDAIVEDIKPGQNTALTNFITNQTDQSSIANRMLKYEK
jgi:splicing factor 1